jgi:hypothetical protein
MFCLDTARHRSCAETDGPCPSLGHLHTKASVEQLIKALLLHRYLPSEAPPAPASQFAPTPPDVITSRRWHVPPGCPWHITTAVSHDPISRPLSRYNSTLCLVYRYFYYIIRLATWSLPTREPPSATLTLEHVQARSGTPLSSPSAGDDVPSSVGGTLGSVAGTLGPSAVTRSELANNQPQ